MKVVLIADDLSGACDAGVQFAARGFSCTVWLEASSQEDDGAEVRILTTETRDDSPEEAVRKVRAACKGPRPVVFKKIDSTLRGHVGPEILAVMESRGYRRAVMTPAFPAMGRTVRDGWLIVSGPKPDSIHIPSLLERQGVPRGAIEVADAETDGDLVRLARAELARRPPPLLAGSAGLAGAVAEVLAGRAGKRRSAAAVPEPSDKPVLLVIGSPHPATKAQLDYVARRRLPCVLFLVEGTRDPAEQRAELLAMLQQHAPSALIMSGGETAARACRAVEARGIRLECEILPGIPWGRLIGGVAAGLPVATKAGGFGNEDALAVMIEFLVGRTRIPG